LALLWAPAALAGTVGVEYVKTLGQSNPYSEPVLTTGGHVAVDPQGFLYAGTPGPGSALAKLTPEGRVVWQITPGIPGFQGVAIDNQYVYTCGSGHYGYRQLFRFRKDDGQKADGWQLEWKTKEPDGSVRAFVLPVALVVDAQYLYVADLPGHEVRRLDKATGREVPFAQPLKIVEPRDLDLTGDGRMLVCTPESILELDLDGRPKRVPLIEKLDNAVAVAFDPKTGGLFVAEGGTDPGLINRVRQFDRDGRPTGWTLGRGGNFQGVWSPDAFAFSEGTGDIALAPDGSLWVNPGWGHKLGKVLRTLSHFTRDGKYTHTMVGVQPFSGLAADGELGVYLGGLVKLSFDNRILWTSGLVRSGAADGFPAVHVDFWPTTPIVAGGRLFVYCGPAGTLIELDPATGRALRDAAKPYKLAAGNLIGGGKDGVYFVKPGDAHVYRVPLDLTGEPAALADLKEPVGKDVTGLAVAEDGSAICLSRAADITAYRLPEGKKLWTQPAQGHAAIVGDLVVTGAAGNANVLGLQVLDLATGAKLAGFGDRAVRGVRPIATRAALAGASTKDGHYLLVEVPGGVRVFKLTHHTPTTVTALNVLVEPQPQEDGDAK